MDIVSLLIIWLVTAVSLYVVSIIPTGVEIDDFKKALISAGVIGLLNALLRPVVGALALPLNVILSTFLVTLLSKRDYFWFGCLARSRFSLALGYLERVVRRFSFGFY